MQTYELTYIISSSLTTEEADALRKDVESFIQSKEGVIVASERSNPQTLAYSIKKHSSGYFVIVEFKLEQKDVKELLAMVEKNDRVLRNLIIVKHPPKVMKAKRTRKPLLGVAKEIMENLGLTGKPAEKKEKKKEKEVKIEEINEKLDEILSE